MSLFEFAVKSPVGRLRIIGGDEGLRAILWPDDDPARVKFEIAPKKSSTPLLLDVASQLEEYFAGRRSEFDVELDFRGTDFQRSVWKELSRIGYGRTTSYGELAKRVGRPTGARAVGAAVGRNPISIVVPCHRVIGASGKLTGFAGGLGAKTHLLELESRR
ncbi:MAG: methylated-DNA--[protein]-cysteine S-methyltransferase [Bdellovibrionota bacterium]